MCVIFSARNLTSSVALVMLVMVGCSDERRDHPVFLNDLNDVDRFPSDDRRQLKAEHESLPGSMVVRVPVDAKGELRAGAKAEVRRFDQDLAQEQLSGERMASVWGEGRRSDRARLAHNLRHIARDDKYGRRRSTQHDLDGYSYDGYGKRGRNYDYRHGYKHSRHGYKHSYHRYGKQQRHRRYHHRNHRGGYRSGYNTPLIYGYNNYSSSYPVNYWRSYYRPYYRSVYSPNLWWGNYRFNNTYYQPSRYRYFVYCPNNYRTRSFY